MKQLKLPLITALLLGLLAATASAQQAPYRAAAQDSLAVPQGVLYPMSFDAEQARLMEQQKTLSRLWAFATLNYLYCDVVSLMDSEMLKQYEAGEVEGFEITEEFLLSATIFMEVPMSMVFLSTALKPEHARIANIAAGSLMTAVQTATLFTDKPKSYYLFSSIVEIGTTSYITYYAWKKMKLPKAMPAVGVSKDAVTVEFAFTF